MVVERRGRPYRTDVQIEPGAQARVRQVVDQADTALEMGTGDVPVLASSRVFAWGEQASHAALKGFLPEDSTSVAMRVQIDHIKAVPVGSAVTALATLERVEGRRYIFVVSVLDDSGDIVATGRIVRVVVETEPFVARACGTPQQ